MAKNPKKARRADGVLSPEELQKAIEEYKAKRAKTDADEEPKQEEPVVAVDAEEEVVEEPATVPAKEPKTVEEKVDFVKDRRDRRDEEGDPKDTDEAMVQIAHQDEDIQMLIDIIDTLLAERDFKETKQEDSADEPIPDTTEKEVPAVKEDGENCENCDDADEDIPDMTEPEINEDAEDEEPVAEEEEIVTDEEDPEMVEEVAEDEDEEEADEPILNTDSVDKIVRERVKIGMIGRLLNLDGLENVKIKTAKKAIINAVHPEMRLDGKSNTYIDVAYDLAVKEAKSMSKKDTNYQKKQMFNNDSAPAKVVKNIPSAVSARERMIERQQKRK